MHVMSKYQQSTFITAMLDGSLKSWGRNYQQAKKRRQRIMAGLRVVGVMLCLTAVTLLWLWFGFTPPILSL